MAKIHNVCSTTNNWIPEAHAENFNSEIANTEWMME